MASFYTCLGHGCGHEKQKDPKLKDKTNAYK